MKFLSTKSLLISGAILATSTGATHAQFLLNNDSAFNANAPGSGRLWGYMFGDYFVKGHSDAYNRGGNNQYTGIPKNRNEFQFRRIYLGYDFNISKKFAAQVLLSAEDNFEPYNPPNSAAASGDLLTNGKETFFIKLANLRWRNVWKGTDLVVGMQYTPAFAMLSEQIWNYRSVERTIADIRRTPSYDMGIGLNGVFDPETKNFGYNLLVSNGTSDKPAVSSNKWYYGDIWAKFWDKKIVIDFYGDYQRLNWTNTWHHDRNMWKLFAAYTTPQLTIGAEGFINNMRGDTKAMSIANGDTTTSVIGTKAEGISLYVHGNIIPNRLRFFARFDHYNPNKNINNKKYTTYAANSTPSGYNTPGYAITVNESTGTPSSATSDGDITAKENFVTAGLDFTPIKNVHFEPNIWYNHYSSQLANVNHKGYDLVYRATFYFVFGK